MSNEESINWLKQITGPAGALVICCFGIYFLGGFIDKMASRHFVMIDQMIEEQKEARKAQNENMLKVSNNLTELSQQIEKMRSCCEQKEDETKN
tara:strand:+ start:612 stop:893 length:282 start_codon:yes stop_codon:yes gene_type:complete